MSGEEYMKLALELAEKGAGYVSPNPMVGAVIVKDGRIIGRGYHQRYGEAHAEVNALRSCTESPEGADLYVTLEPCCHYGKTPPCTEAIIENRIANVFIGTLDINPQVAGKSVDILRQHGIGVKTGILEAECKRLIKVFRKFMSERTPFVLMKYAMTMDGKIATYAHNSQWISGEESRKKVHETRHAFSAIMVGVNTVIRDNPMLTCRIENGINPLRVICDTNLRTPLDSRVVETADSVPTCIFTACDDELKKEPYIKRGCKLINVSRRENHTDLSEVMKILGSMEIDSVLLEGGGALNWSALKQQVVDEVQTYVAPKIFGGAGASPVGGEGVEFPKDAVMLRPYSVSQIGEDYLIESEVVYTCLQE